MPIEMIIYFAGIVLWIFICGMFKGYLPEGNSETYVLFCFLWPVVIPISLLVGISYLMYLSGYKLMKALKRDNNEK
jgi:hypothetical protein